MQHFLDYTCEQLNNLFEKREQEIASAMEAFTFSVRLTIEIFNSTGAFRKYTGEKYEDRYNRAVIDIMLYYFAQFRTNREAILAKREQVVSAYMALCSDDSTFLSSLESTTKSLSSVHYRFRKWGEKLLSITGNELNIPAGY